MDLRQGSLERGCDPGSPHAELVGLSSEVDFECPLKTPSSHEDTRHVLMLQTFSETEKLSYAQVAQSSFEVIFFPKRCK